MRNKLTVMVTGVGGGGHGEQILKALKLAKTKYHIIGTDMSPISSGLTKVDIPYLVPPANDKKYIPTILAICRKHKVKALFHGTEPELKMFSKFSKKLRDSGLFLPINPKKIIDICMDKFQTMNFLKNNNFCCPKTTCIKSLKSLNKINYLPVVLKPSVGGGASAHTYIAQTKKELHAFSEYLLKISPEFIAQEYIGTPESEYTVGVLISMDGELLNSIAVKRSILSSLSNRIKIPNKTKNSSLGPILAISSGISQGEIGRFPEVTKQCEKIALKLGCRGAVNIQCRLIDGKVYVFEINPRFSGTTSLRAMVGYNEPDILIRKHIFMEKIANHFSYKSATIVRCLNETLIKKLNFKKGTDLL